MNVHYGDVLIKFGECLDVSKEEVTFIMDDTSVNKYKSSFLNNGDVIIADAAEDETVGKCTEIVGLTTQTVISGLHTIPCRPIQVFASGYLGYYMNSNAYHDQLLPLIQGTKVSSISKSALNDTVLIYPKSNEEQTVIAKSFTNLNNLITLHQRE
ncbi:MULTISPECIES: restriction endonuclease subunit S domain-containing protein [Clostridium]|uniref:restriction endonuclease subunit S n=1 Tax=Clostridium TaxID=1485 RepID=UPI00069E24B1